jgi:DNA-3-methyladenine glycosylase I
MTPKIRQHGDLPGQVTGDPISDWYSTDIWGKRIERDDDLFEIMSLQIFQAGLNWRMILARRDAFRNAFYGWRIAKVADMNSRHLDRLLMDASIIRNRKKIEACIANARVALGFQRAHVSFCHWFYEVLEGDNLSELQKTLRGAFRFMGPEIARMWLMACGRISADG